MGIAVRKKYKNIQLFIVVFFTFLGFYAGLLALANANALFLSRFFTIPTRMLVIFCLFLLFVRKGIVIRERKIFMIFLSFALLYLFRIVVDLLSLNIYYLSPPEHLFYFFSFCFLPFIFTSNLRLIKLDYEICFKAFLLSSFLFSILSLIFLRNFIGSVGRVSVTTSGGEAIVSPLILSYCSTLSIGVCLSYLLENKVRLKRFVVIVGIIILSVIPFFLGSSRGSLFALFLPFIFVLLSKGNAIGNFKLIIIGLIALVLVIFLAEALGSNLIDRFTNVSKDIDQESSSAIRLAIWKQSLSQFADHPLFGDSFLLKIFNNYPHNLFVEVLQTTGIIGFIPFISLVIMGFTKSFKIFRNIPNYSWIGVIYIQTIAQGLFSGGIHSSAWFWFSLAFLLQVDIDSLKVSKTNFHNTGSK